MMRDVLSAGCESDPGTAGFHGGHARQHLGDLLERFNVSEMERWSDVEWETIAVQALWRVCRDGAQGVEWSAPPAHEPVRHRDLLLEATREDSDALVHDVLIRFCAAFTDQGLTQWPLPHRALGFYRAFCELYRRTSRCPGAWCQGLAEELERLDRAGFDPLESIVESLDLLGVVEDEWDEYVTATLLAFADGRECCGRWKFAGTGSRCRLPWGA